MEGFPPNWRIRGAVEKLGIPQSEATPGKLYSKQLEGKMYSEIHYDMDVKEWPILTEFLADHGFREQTYRAPKWYTAFNYKIIGKTYLLFQMDQDLVERVPMFMIIVGYGTPNVASKRPAPDAKATEMITYNTWVGEKRKAESQISSLMNEYKKTFRFRPT